MATIAPLKPYGKNLQKKSLLKPRPGDPVVGPNIVSDQPEIDPTTTGSTAPPMSLDALMQRQKELAGQQVPMTDMTSPWQGISYALQKGLQGFQTGRNERNLETGRAELADLIAGLPESGLATPEQISEIMQRDQKLGLAIYDQAMKARGAESWEDIAAPPGAKPGSFWQRNSKTGEVKEVGAGGQTINVGGSEEDPVHKKLSEKEGENWAALLDAAGVSAAAGSDFANLAELVKIAPQGPLMGRLAEAFPEFTTAGALFQSIVKRVAPTLRVAGSGSTSDIEYEGMLTSLGSLRNSPEANAATIEVMRAKSDLNIAIGRVIDQFQGHKISDVEARAQIDQLRNASLRVSPGVKKLVEAAKKAGSGKPDLKVEPAIEPE